MFTYLSTSFNLSETIHANFLVELVFLFKWMHFANKNILNFQHFVFVYSSISGFIWRILSYYCSLSTLLRLMKGSFTFTKRTPSGTIQTCLSFKIKKAWTTEKDRHRGSKKRALDLQICWPEDQPLIIKALIQNFWIPFCEFSEIYGKSGSFWGYVFRTFLRQSPRL